MKPALLFLGLLFVLGFSGTTQGLSERDVRSSAFSPATGPAASRSRSLSPQDEPNEPQVCSSGLITANWPRAASCNSHDASAEEETGKDPAKRALILSGPQDELEKLRAHNRNYGKWVRRLQSENRRLRRFAQPNYHVQNALRLAATIWPVSYWQLKSVAKCESGLWPFARNGRYRGLFQTGPMFERGPFGSFSVWDPYANVFTAALTASRQGWRQWSCKP
jgi:hypothetical protein